jgi:hypothetical protein
VAACLALRNEDALDMVLRIIRTVFSAATAYVAWVLLWGLPATAYELARGFESVAHGSAAVPPRSSWFHVGDFTQWVYAPAAVLAIVVPFFASRFTAPLAATWLVAALVLALAGYFGCGANSLLGIVVALGAVAAAAFWQARPARPRAA